jgi:hypothetical protein
MRQALVAIPMGVIWAVWPQLGCGGNAADHLVPDGAIPPVTDATDIHASPEIDASRDVANDPNAADHLVSDGAIPPVVDATDFDASPEIDAARDVADDATVSIPACLQDLIGTCPLEGSCQAWVNDGGAAGAPLERLCYESGIRVIVREDPPISLCNTLKRTTEVRRADGTLCYTKAFERINHCEGEAYEWRDAAGTLVASGTFVRAGGGLPPYLYSIRCAATPETASCMEPYLMSTRCLSFPPNPGGCAEGDCP